jgi:hypothetical protein
MAETNELNETKKLTTRNNERLKRDTTQAKYDEDKNKLEIARLKRESEF